MYQPLEVRLTLTERPVALRDPITGGVDQEYPLGDGAFAWEYFPPNIDETGANYVLTLRKSVSRAEDVQRAEDNLLHALQMIAAAWPFAGGSHMAIETRETISSPRCESNAKLVEQQLLAASGRAHLAASGSAAMSSIATYRCPPLRLAVDIAKLTRRDFPTRQVLQYYHTAIIDRDHRSAAEGASWFISLYKIRDLFDKLYCGSKAAKANLGIPGSDWSFFGNILNNNDLRHAEVNGVAPTVLPADIDKLYRMAWHWVASYLVTKGLPDIRSL